ncbi:GAP family protein [Photobacterium satsumensis]|uniref:GAP family protein n=1 Tax=Photobacterium satsumensis TaxID=2910239 RepID=UPI003D13299C
MFFSQVDLLHEVITILPILVAISLFDSTSMVSIGIIPFISLLGNKKPFSGTFSFLLGIYTVCMIFGLIMLLGGEFAVDTLGPFISEIFNSNIRYILQIFIGLLIVFMSVKSYRALASNSDSNNQINIPSGNAYLLGATLTVLGVPGAFPYLGAISQILSLDAGLPMSLLLAAFYNFVFLTPFILIMGIVMLYPKYTQKLIVFINNNFKKGAIGILFLIGILLLGDAAYTLTKQLIAM